jgi:hypothetical protein
MTEKDRKLELDVLEKLLINVVPTRGELERKLAHLPTGSLVDAIVFLKSCSWDLEGLRAFSGILARDNGEYRVEVFKRLTDISPEFLSPDNIRSFCYQTERLDSLAISDVTNEHITWAAVRMLVGGGTYYYFEGVDIGALRAPVDAAYEFMEKNWDDRAVIAQVITERRVYKVEDIELLLTGGAPLRQGAL